jgi:hypothetical protein
VNLSLCLIKQETLHHDHVWQRGGVPSSFLSSVLDIRSGQLHAPIALPPENDPQYPLDISLL